MNYRSRDIINLVKQYTKKKLHKELALTEIYTYIYDIEQPMEANKVNKDKNNNKK